MSDEVKSKAISITETYSKMNTDPPEGLPPGSPPQGSPPPEGSPPGGGLGGITGDNPPDIDTLLFRMALAIHEESTDLTQKLDGLLSQKQSIESSIKELQDKLGKQSESKKIIIEYYKDKPKSAIVTAILRLISE